MTENKYKPTELELKMIQYLKEEGYPYTAKYIEMFGKDARNPAFTRGANKETEDFYKICVEEGHPYDWYFEFPDDAVF